MSKESQSIAKWVRMTLTQLGIDTLGLDILVSGSTVHLKGKLKKIKSSGFDTDRTYKKLMETAAQRLRSHRDIKRVLFL